MNLIVLIVVISWLGSGVPGFARQTPIRKQTSKFVYLLNFSVVLLNSIVGQCLSVVQEGLIDL